MQKDESGRVKEMHYKLPKEGPSRAKILTETNMGVNIGLDLYMFVWTRRSKIYFDCDMNKLVVV